MGYEENKTVSTESRGTVMSRLRSWAVWISILGAVGIILNALGVFAKWGIDSTAWDVIVNAVGSVLVGFGILNNPTDKKSF